MARKLELRTVAIDQVNGGKALVYGELMLMILRAPRPGAGVTLDEMIKVLAVVEPIEQAMVKGQEIVTLTDDQWSLLLTKLNEFQFAFVDKELTRFGMAIRAAPEIGVDRLPARPNGELGVPLNG